MRRSNVDLPAPSGPTSPVMRPGAMAAADGIEGGHGAEALADALDRDERRHAQPRAAPAKVTVTGMPWRSPSSASSTMTRRR